MSIIDDYRIDFAKKKQEELVRGVIESIATVNRFFEIVPFLTPNFCYRVIFACDSEFRSFRVRTHL